MPAFLNFWFVKAKTAIKSSLELIEILLFRLETCENSESGFSYSDKYDKNIIDRWFNAIKKNFPEPESDYIDNF